MYAWIWVPSMVPHIQKGLWVAWAYSKGNEDGTISERTLIWKKYEKKVQAFNLPSLYYKQAWRDVIELYKHIKGIYTIKHDYIKMEPATTTRGHNCKILKQRTNKWVRTFSWNEQETWNRLPADIVSVSRLNAFKSRIDKRWLQYRYSQHSPHETYMFTRRFKDRVNLWTGLIA